MKLDRKKYVKIRHAQAAGDRTIEELKKNHKIVIENEDEIAQVEAILENACECKKVSVAEILNAIENGYDTVEKVSKCTKASTGCGVCKPLVENIVKNKR